MSEAKAADYAHAINKQTIAVHPVIKTLVYDVTLRPGERAVSILSVLEDTPTPACLTIGSAKEAKALMDAIRRAAARAFPGTVKAKEVGR